MKLNINEFFSRLSDREKTILYITIFIISIVFLDQMILSPIMTKMSQLSKDIDFQEETIKRNLTILARKDKIVEEQNKYSPYLVARRKSDEEEDRSFSLELQALAKDTIDLIDIRSSGINKIGLLSRQYVIDLNFEAEMKYIFQFLYKIENSDKLYSVEKYNIRSKPDMSMEEDDEEEEPNVLTCSISISKVIIPK
ncbi:MAG: hypothetical protein KAX15_03635 [Candidatus Omnitrophica bacterium]|nr:hypothetical protein [Candidatus Omnitrophota bacterium]